MGLVVVQQSNRGENTWDCEHPIDGAGGTTAVSFISDENRRVYCG